MNTSNGTSIASERIATVIKIIVLGFIVFTVVNAVTIFHLGGGWGAFNEYMAYMLPCLAAIVVCARIFLGDRVSNEAAFSLSLFFLYAGILANAYNLPCSKPIIANMSVTIALAFFIALLMGWRKTWPPATKKFVFWVMLPMVAFSILIIFFYYDALLWTIGKEVRCFPKGAG